MPSEDSDQPAHLRRLIRVFAVHSLVHHSSAVSSGGGSKDWSDCGDAHADLSFNWVHMSEGRFSYIVTGLFIYYNNTYDHEKMDLIVNINSEFLDQTVHSVTFVPLLSTCGQTWNFIIYWQSDVLVETVD